uniref:Uncharacterized protein n=1 Tax=Rhizophora mucronata TaxID=61149 RepID=A0A2P2IKS5_RHIMU
MQLSIPIYNCFSYNYKGCFVNTAQQISPIMIFAFVLIFEKLIQRSWGP